METGARHYGRPPILGGVNRGYRQAGALVLVACVVGLVVGMLAQAHGPARARPAIGDVRLGQHVLFPLPGRLVLSSGYRGAIDKGTVPIARRPLAFIVRQRPGVELVRRSRELPYMGKPLPPKLAQAADCRVAAWT